MNILKKHNPDGPSSWRKPKIERETGKLLDEIYEWSKKLYGESQQSVLLVLQGMDASGKDGLVRELFQKVSPAWVNVHSFKKPTDEELAHDFLWRVHSKTPKKGMITVFNRSHYEDILVPSVYGYIDKKTIDNRYKQINDFEQMLEENGTKIIKIYMNLSLNVQERKLRERIDTPEKHWKHSDGDWETRSQWNEFMEVYERIFERCNEVPWHIVPCNRNWTKVYSVAKIIVEELRKMDPKFPPLDSNSFTPNYEKAKISY
ncbi:MAG: polyphosphate kinase [Bacteroidetes bacterium]|nr:polyphosphate kinase [Bacteroidota bacterium]